MSVNTRVQILLAAENLSGCAEAILKGSEICIWLFMGLVFPVTNRILL